MSKPGRRQKRSHFLKRRTNVFLAESYIIDGGAGREYSTISLSSKARLSDTAIMCSPPPSEEEIDTLRRQNGMPISSIDTIYIDI